MAQGAGRDGQGVDGGGLTHEPVHTGENDQMILHRFQIDMGFSLHQLREGGRVSGMLVRGECRNKAALIVVSQVVSVVVGFRQADPDFSQSLTKTSEMEGFGVRDYAIKVKDHRCDCGHGIISILWVWLRDIKRADYSTGARLNRRECVWSAGHLRERNGRVRTSSEDVSPIPNPLTLRRSYQIHPATGL